MSAISLDHKNSSTIHNAFIIRPNRFELICTLFLFIVAFGFIQWAYPFPNTYADTGAFVTVAGNGLIGNFRPIGYSWFMALSHFITPHPDVLVFLQTALYFISTLLYYLSAKTIFVRKDGWSWKAFFVLFMFSPTCIFLCNFVISDSLFISLTNLWLASLLWILGTKKTSAILWNALFLLLLLQTRFIALFYPLLTVITLFFTFFKSNKIRFLVYSGLQVFLFLGVIWFTTWKTEKNVGVKVFSGFSGWQKANNAMHILPHIQMSPGEIADPEIRTTHTFILKNTPTSLYPPKDSVIVVYLWSGYSPLKKYLFQLKGNSKKSYLHFWHLSSKPLGRWGDFMIRKYPTEFARYYLYPNFLFLFSLSNEALFEFPGPSQQMRDWFEWGNKPVQPKINFLHQFLAATTSKSFNLLWITFTISIVGLCIPKHLKITPLQHKALCLVSFFCITYIAMSVYASPLVLRYLLVLRHSLILVPFLTFFDYLTKGKD